MKASRYEKRAQKEAIKEQRNHYHKRQRNKRIINYVLLGIILIGIAYGLYVWWYDNAKQGQNDALAQCLTQKGAAMYGTDWCPHCQDQKRLFGPSFKYITYVNCDLNKEACADAGVEGYPTWTFGDGSNATGSQELSILAERVGCR